jgi:hypothetical protein
VICPSFVSQVRHTKLPTLFHEERKSAAEYSYRTNVFGSEHEIHPPIRKARDLSSSDEFDEKYRKWEGNVLSTISQ